MYRHISLSYYSGLIGEMVSIYFDHLMILFDHSFYISLPSIFVGVRVPTFLYKGCYSGESYLYKLKNTKQLNSRIDFEVLYLGDISNEHSSNGLCILGF